MNTDDLKNVSLSHATMKPEDLIPCFIDAIREIAKDDEKLLQELKSECMEHGLDIEDHHIILLYAGEGSDWLLDYLFDTLNDLAPEGYYFGAHPGDGSDYGFWKCEDYDEGTCYIGDEER